MADQPSGGSAPFEDFSTFDSERLRQAINGDPASLRRSGEAFEKVRKKLTHAHDRLHQQAGKLQNALQGTSGDRFQSYCDAVLENNDRVTTALQDGQYQQTLSHAGSETEHARTEIAALLVTYSKATVLAMVLTAASGHSPALAAMAGIAEDLAQRSLRKARTRLEGMATMLQSTGSQLRPLNDGGPPAQHDAAGRSATGADRQNPPGEHASGSASGEHQAPAGHQRPDHTETEQQKRAQKQHAAQARHKLGQTSQAAVDDLQTSPSGAVQGHGAGGGADRGGDEQGASGPRIAPHAVASQNHPEQQNRAQQNQSQEHGNQQHGHQQDRGQNQQGQNHQQQGQPNHGQQGRSGDRSAAAQQASRAAQQANTAMSASLNGAGGRTSQGSSENLDKNTPGKAPSKVKSRFTLESGSPASPQRGASTGDHRPQTESGGPNESAAARKTAQQAQQQLQSMRGGSGGDSGPASATAAGPASAEPPLAGAGPGGAGLADFLNPGGGSSPATGGDGGASLAASGEASAPSVGGSLGGSAATAGLGADATAPGPQPPVGAQPSGGGGSAGAPSGAAGASGSGFPMMPPMGGMGAAGGGGAGGGGGRERQTWLSADDGTWDDEHTPGSHVLGRDSETS